VFSLWGARYVYLYLNRTCTEWYFETAIPGVTCKLFFYRYLHVPLSTGSQLAMLRRHPYGWIDRWFDIGDVRRAKTLFELCPCARVPERRSLTFDSSIPDLIHRPPLANASALLVCGLFQSWKYAAAVEDELRRRLRWKPKIISAVRRYRCSTVSDIGMFNLLLIYFYWTASNACNADDCDRWSRASVSLSVCLLLCLTRLRCANTAERIEVLLGLEILEDKNIVLDGSPGVTHGFNAALTKLLSPRVVLKSMV